MNGYRLHSKFIAERQIIGATAVLFIVVLLSPFLKTVALAAIVFCAVRIVRRRYREMPPPRRALVNTCGAGGCVGIAFVVHSAVTQLAMAADPDSAISEQARMLVHQTAARASEFMRHNLKLLLPDGGLASRIESLLDQMVSLVASPFVNLTFAIPAFGLHALFAIFVLMLLGRYYDGVTATVGTRLPAPWGTAIARAIARAEDSAYAAVISVGLVALLQAAVFSMGARIAGVGCWPAVFFATFLCSMIPPFGAIPVVAVVGAGVGLNSGVGALAEVLGFGFVTLLLEYGLKAALFARLGRVLPVSISFFAAIGGVAVFGFAGLLLGPFLLFWSSSLLKDAFSVHDVPGGPRAVKRKDGRSSAPNGRWFEFPSEATDAGKFFGFRKPLYFGRRSGAKIIFGSLDGTERADFERPNGKKHVRPIENVGLACARVSDVHETT